MAHVYEARGERKKALEQITIAEKLAPEAVVRREALRVRSEGELAPAEIDAFVRVATAAEGRDAPDPELLLTAARAHLNLGPRSQARAIEALDQLAGSRKISPSFATRYGILLAVARLSRGKPEDLALTSQMLDEIDPLVTDPALRNFVTALQGLARASSAP